MKLSDDEIKSVVSWIELVFEENNSELAGYTCPLFFYNSHDRCVDCHEYFGCGDCPCCSYPVGEVASIAIELLEENGVNYQERYK